MVVMVLESPIGGTDGSGGMVGIGLRGISCRLLWWVYDSLLMRIVDVVYSLPQLILL